MLKDPTSFEAAQVSRSRYERERRARKRAETLLEKKEAELSEANLRIAYEAREAQSAFSRLTRMQGEMVGILDALLAANLREANAAIADALKRTGKMIEVDRICVFQIPSKGDVMSSTHEWCAPGVPTIMSLLQDLPREGFEHRFRDFEMGRDIWVPDVSALEDDTIEKNLLQGEGIQSMVAIPMLQDGVLHGFISFEAVQLQRSFLPGEVHLIRSIVKVIGSILCRRDVEARLNAAHAERREQSRRLQAVLAAMPDLVLEVSPEGRFITWHSGSIIFPRTLSEAFKGRLLEEVLPPHIAAEGRRAMADLQRHGSFGDSLIPFDLGDGLHWFQLSAAMIAEAGYLFVLRDVTEARAQHIEIERLSEIAQRTTNVVVVLDIEGNIEWVNKAFEEMTGWKLKDVRGTRPHSFLNSELTDPETDRRISKALARGEAVQEEIQYRTRDGRDSWISLDVQPFHDEAGEIRSFMAVGSDVTELRLRADAARKSAEVAERSQAMLEAAVDALQDGFVIFDNEDRLVICNDRYREIYSRTAPLIQPGVTFETMLRNCVGNGEYPEAVGCEEDWIAQRMASHRLPYFEKEQQRSDGRWLRVFEKATSDGGRVGLRVDITDLKQAEARAVANLATAMEASHDGIAIADADGCFVYMNRSHLDLFGFASEAEVIGRPWSILYAPEVAIWLEMHALPELKATGRWSGELMGVACDGSPVDQDISMTMKEDGGYLCIVRDMRPRRSEVAERDRLREELNMAQRREVVSQMAAGLAHDFNNLLATISGNATLIETAANPGSLMAIGATRVLAACDQATELVRRMLTLGARQPEPVLLDLRKPVQDAAELLRAGLRAPLRLHLELAEEPTIALADPTDILQVVLNLAINARDAMEGRAGYINVTVGGAKPDDLEGPFAMGQVDPDIRYQQISISDQGNGMDAETAKKIFQPYFTTKGDKGTGLGLAVVASILRANHGALRLETAPGEGTRFCLLWPAEALAQQETVLVEAPVLAKTGRLDGKAILLVDDQVDVLAVLTAFLESAGAEVAATNDPEDVLASVQEFPDAWDLLVTDFDMPGLTGAELAERIRAVAPELPIVLVTALAGVAGRSDEAFTTVIGKPVERETLVTASEEAIVKKQIRG
ncbi:MAG: PAS domain-containing protein [Pseudorhodobacter sp.]